MALYKRDRARYARWLERELSARTGTPVEVHISPIGKYPTASFDVSFRAGLPFPSKDDGLIESPNTPVIEGVVARFDAALERACSDLGLTAFSAAHPWGLRGEPYVLAFSIPPMGFDAVRDAEALRYGRWMTEAEVAAHIEATGDEPFTDERWICTHYACINVFRAARMEDAS